MVLDLRPQPTPPPVATPPRQRPWWQRRPMIVAAGLGLMALGGGAGAWWWHQHTAFPAAIRQSVGFGLLYPAALPAGWHLDRSSVASTGSVVTFTAATSDSRRAIFTVQRRPATFDYDTFYKQGLADATQFITPAGQAALGRVQNRLVGSLVASDSWVLVTPNSAAVSQTEMRQMLSGLKPL